MIPLLMVAFGAAFLGFLLVLGLVDRVQRRRAERRLAFVRAVRLATEGSELGEAKEPPAVEDASLAAGRPTASRSSLVRRLLGPLGLLLGRLEGRLRPQVNARRAEMRLRQAGLRLTMGEYQALRLVAATLAAALALLVGRGQIWAFAGAAVGYWLPGFYVERTLKSRHRAFAQQLPEALTVIANSLRSGYSFLQATEAAAAELPEPLASELGQVIKETRVDIPLEVALPNLGVRMPSRELSLVVTAVLVQRQVGGNLAGLLDQVSETVRSRLRMEREVKALTAQGRLSGMIIGLLPIFLGLFISAVNPEYMSLLVREPLGQMMIGLALVMEVLGGLAIRRMVQLDI